MVEQIIHFPLKYLFVIQSSSVGVIFEHGLIAEPKTESQCSKLRRISGFEFLFETMF